MKKHPNKPMLKNRTRQRQRIRIRVVVAVASVATMLSTMLILYFQLYKKEEAFANEEIFTEDALPTNSTLENPMVIQPDTNSRNGVSFKVAKAIPKTTY